MVCSLALKFQRFWEDGNETKVMIVRGIRAEDFHSFLKWVYTKKLEVEEMDEELNAEDNTTGFASQTYKGKDIIGDTSHVQCNASTYGTESRDTLVDSDAQTSSVEHRSAHLGFNRRSRIFARLLNLYIFADMNQITTFKTTVMLEFQRAIVSMRVSPGLQIVRHAFNNLDSDSPMCKYLILCNSHPGILKSANDHSLLTLSPKILVLLLRSVIQRNESILPVPDWFDNWCDYHEHEDVQSRRDCENSRNLDADLMKRLRMQLTSDV